MNDGLAFAVLLLAFLANFSFALSGFGSSIIFQIGWQLYDLLGILELGADFADGIMNLTLIGIFISSVQAWHLRRHINFKLACLFAITRAIGHIAGAWILVSLSVSGLQWIKRILGVFFLLIAAHKCYKAGHCKCRKSYVQVAHPEQPVGPLSLQSWNVRTAATATGLASGFMAGLLGAGGPPIMIFLSYHVVQKEEYRATAAVMIVFANFVGACFMGSVSDKYFKPSLVPQYTVMITGALAGLIAGNSVSRYVTQELFGDIVLGLLIFGSMLMIIGAEGREQLPLVVPVIAACLLVVLFLGLFVKISQQHSSGSGSGGGDRIDGSKGPVVLRQAGSSSSSSSSDLDLAEVSHMLGKQAAL
jgi:uncharacterized membrane protein YfcA